MKRVSGSLFLCASAMVTALLSSSCGGPVVCGEVTYATCEDLADARAVSTDPVFTRDLDTCFQEQCAPAAE